MIFSNWVFPKKYLVERASGELYQLKLNVFRRRDRMSIIVLYHLGWMIHLNHHNRIIFDLYIEHGCVAVVAPFFDICFMTLGFGRRHGWYR